MPLIETELGHALEPPVKRKANTTLHLRSGALRAKAKRVAFGAPEVMVKITGFGKGAAHVQAHLAYISRNGKVELENDRGEILSGRDEVKGLFQDWNADFTNAKRHKNQRDTMHLVVSMPETTDPRAVRQAARDFAKAHFGKNHEYVFALHTDAPHPHCHVTVKCLGFDGARLNPRKADLQHWRESFAQNLRELGIFAEATPRRARGVVRKAEPSVIRHIEHGDKTHPPRVSKIRAQKVYEVSRELAQEAHGIPVPARPWEDFLSKRQQQIRRAWLAAAHALEREQTRLIFNGKEAGNEQPDYAKISRSDARTSQRAAAVYQSQLEQPGSATSPRAIASLRNLSSLTVVQHGRSAQMLLHPDASDRLGWHRSTDHEMRWSRAGDPRTQGDQRGVMAYQRTTEDNQALAQRIRTFVTAMPSLETERHHFRNAFAERFRKTLQKAPQNGLPPHKDGQDLER